MLPLDRFATPAPREILFATGAATTALSCDVRHNISRRFLYQGGIAGPWPDHIDRDSEMLRSKLFAVNPVIRCQNLKAVTLEDYLSRAKKGSHKPVLAIKVTESVGKQRNADAIATAKDFLEKVKKKYPLSHPRILARISGHVTRNEPFITQDDLYHLKRDISRFRNRLEEIQKNSKEIELDDFFELGKKGSDRMLVITGQAPFEDCVSNHLMWTRNVFLKRIETAFPESHEEILGNVRNETILTSHDVWVVNRNIERRRASLGPAYMSNAAPKVKGPPAPTTRPGPAVAIRTAKLRKASKKAPPPPTTSPIVSPELSRLLDSTASGAKKSPPAQGAGRSAVQARISFFEGLTATAPPSDLNRAVGH